MKKTAILCGILFSGFLLTGASAQESRSDLLKAQETLLNQLISLEEKKVEEGGGDLTLLFKAQADLQKMLIKQAKSIEDKIKGQKELIAMAEKQADKILEGYKAGLFGYTAVVEQKAELLKARADLLDMEGDEALDAGRKELQAEIEKEEKQMEDFFKRGYKGGVASADEHLAAKARFAELRVDLARTKAGRIKYQKELIDLLDKLQQLLEERYKAGLANYSVDTKLALIKAKLKLLDLEESV